VTRVTLSQAAVINRQPGEGSSFWREMADGVHWLAHHPAMRTLALTIFAFNITYGAAWSVLVLYAGERLHMDAVGFGLLTTASALGGFSALRPTARSSAASHWATSCASDS